MSAGAHAAPRRTVAVRRLPPISPVASIFMLVFAAQFSFGVWMAARGFLWGDAFFRSANALFVLHSADPKLANVGFVWMPLPTLLNLPWVAFYPLWPSIVSSGVAPALTSAVCGGATAAVLLITADRLGLPRGVGWAYALLISANPMVFLYGGTGMSEAVAAPFLIAAVCFVTLFWHSGQRWWIGAAGVALALGFGSSYEALPYGAALFAALVGGILWPSEARPSAPLGRARAVEGLGILFLVPAVFAGALWVGANAVIMKDPLFFVSGDYGYSSFASGPYLGGAPIVTGDAVGAVALVAERTWIFLIPLAFVLLLRIVDRRLWRINTAAAVLLALSVPFGMVAPMAYVGSPMGFARYLMYPLFAAAGWGLFEMAVSKRRRRATALVFAGWIAAIPGCLWLMSSPVLGVQEYPELKALIHGRDARDLGRGVWAGAGGAGDPIATRARLTGYLEREVLGRRKRLLLDSFQEGPAIGAQVRPGHQQFLIMGFDRRFRPALSRPAEYRISYFLVPNPKDSPQDAIARTRPRLWAGREPGFELAKSFSEPSGQEWRIYAVRPGVRPLRSELGGAG
jgi:hypothetical protein